jgi:uncharacterized membrane protein
MGAYWLFHYRMFRYINRHDPWLIILNFCFLLCIVLMFAPINYYAAYSQNTAAGIYFGVWQTLTAFLLVLIWWRAAGKRRLLDNQITDGQIKRFGACLWSNLAIIFVLMFVSAAVGPRTYLFVYLAALGLAMLVIHFIGRRSRSQAVQVA